MTDVKRITSADDLRESYGAFLTDESKLRAEGAHDLWLPRSHDELAAAIRENFNANRPTRVSGGRTGITGGSVAESGESIVSTDAMKTIGPLEHDAARNEHFIRVQAGVTLHELNEHLAGLGAGVFFPVDPTETWAAFGGMASTNASGARSYFYGSVRPWIRWARIVLADGSILELRRGADRLHGLELRLGAPPNERRMILDAIAKPKTKCTIGYTVEPDEDVIDLFIGAEGTLGVFTDLEIRLAPVPRSRLSYMQLFPSIDSALAFVRAIRERKDLRILALEFLDRHSLKLACANPKGSKTAPANLVDAATDAAVYIEAVFEEEDEIVAIYEVLAEILEPLGVSPDRSYAGIEDRELRELKAFRHAVPEQINATIAQRKKDIPSLHKIATDMAVPDESLEKIYSLYQSALDSAGLEYAVFGHAGNNHFHVNMLPRSAEELAVAKKLYRMFAEEVVRLGGAAAAEHGLGRLKREFLPIQYSSEQIRRMRAIKEFFDPRLLLNRGVLFPDAE